MDSEAKILILYGSAGHGHENAARAVEEACRRAAPRAAVRLADALDFSVPFFARSYRRTYLFLIDRLPWIWGFFYFLFDFRLANWFVRRLRRIVNAVFGKGLERLLIEENPSVLVCTHFFPLEVAAALKKRGKIRSKLMIVVTDYLPHFFWVDDAADFYAVALPETAEGLKTRGVPEFKIRVLGIPIEAKFETRRRRADAASAAGVRSDVFTALLTSGGAGIGNGRRIAGCLLDIQKPVQLLTVCGNNRGLFEELSSLASCVPDRLKVFGFVKNMDVLMEASDLVIGKSGGLTLTECLAKNKPMIVIRPVPGQETRNARCAALYGAALVALSVRDAVRQTQNVMDDPTLLRRLTEGAAGMARPHAALDIAKWILAL